MAAATTAADHTALTMVQHINAAQAVRNTVHIMVRHIQTEEYTAINHLLKQF